MKKIPKIAVWIVLAIILLVIVQIIFSRPAPNEQMEAVWAAGDFINFVAAVVFGIIAAYQSKKANDLSRVQLFSIINIRKAMIAEKSSEYPKRRNSKMETDLYLNFPVDETKKGQCFHFDVEFENQSDYPITKIKAMVKNVDVIQYGIIREIEKPVNIAAHSVYTIRFVIPSNKFKENKTDELSLQIVFCNVYSCSTRAMLHFKNILILSLNTSASYHNIDPEFNLAQITNLSSKEDIDNR